MGEEQDELTNIALEMVLRNGTKRPLSIPESEWPRVLPILTTYALDFMENTRFPILKPARPHFQSEHENPNIITYEDSFALSNDPNVKLAFTPVKACLGIAIIDSISKKRMTAHILNRSLRVQQATVVNDCKELVEQIGAYWGDQQTSKPSEIIFISQNLNTQRAQYQNLVIEGIKKTFPNTQDLKFLDAEDIVV